MAHTRATPRLVVSDPEILDAASDQARELAQLARDIADSPASSKIVEFLVHAGSLGLDVGEPGVVRRAISAGTASYETEQQAKAAGESYAIFSRVDRDHHSPLVYYMRNGDRVKIGTSTHLSKRINTISPQGVMAVEPGGRKIEKLRHEEYADLRLRGEWFKLSPRLVDHIVELRERFTHRVGISLEVWLARHTASPRSNPRTYGARLGSYRLDRPLVAVALPGQDLPDDAHELLPAVRVAAALHISPQCFDVWRKKGKVQPAATTENGRKLYRLSEAMAVPLRRAG